jgi:CPA2 family monovalent cation:H+ antiporter-2
LGGAQGLVWLVAVLAGLPVVIAILRKLQAFGLLVAEMSLTESAAGRDMTAVRSLLANTIWLAGAVGLGLWVLLISAAFLPQWPALLVLVAIVVVIGAGFWRFFIQIHAKAQVALRETLASAEAPHAPAAEEPLPVLLKGAQLEMIEISAGSAGAGKLIRELELRRKTGASIVGIERTGATIINPGPDEELQSADKVFLLGQPAQLKAARALLTAPNPSEDRSPG